MTDDRWAAPGPSDLYDSAALATPTGQPGGGVRLPDGRALSWAEYGSTRGVPCLLLPDLGSSRLAPRWLLHECTPPAEVRLLALDRPGIGDSDPVGLGGQEDPVEDLQHLVSTLAVGRVAVIGVGQGASDAVAFAAGYPAMVSTVLAISPRMTAEPAPRRHRWLRPRGLAAAAPAGPLAAWLRAAGDGADLTAERTWERATHRMDPRAARILGQRWQDPTFRQGLADDLNEAAGSWTTPAVAPPPLNWEQPNCPVPVRIWHGRDETGTTLARARNIADLHGWHVTTVDGGSAMFGSWPQILTAAAGSFDHTAF
jgi:pimeloyl-ACP methyl ester carboxylesterase